MLNGKSILITGGTGSFGKCFTGYVLKRYPSINKIIIYSRDEFKQFEMQNMPEFKPFLSKLRFFIGDVRDKDRLLMAFENVDFVIHAAALKQVPSCEYNPFEAIKTNVIGAQNVIEASFDRNVKKVVALSTDKACAPINLYGATKLCSDKLFITASAYRGGRDIKFAVVRYGNVAGSRGSVIPFFMKLAKEGVKELPITSEKMTRFWITLEDAVETVDFALNDMKGGELYVKKIPSMKIVDLAKAIAPNCKIKIIGVRSGEKIHEQMITKADAVNTVEFDSRYVILPNIDKNKIKNAYPNAKFVSSDFEYNSENNNQWLTVEAMKELIMKNM
ncbi:MAG: UDP-N-acetylglucosamine 4,6-dehydratase (inverting) [Elusimicrobiota bacterium]|jgi:UDP-N-acetylglucosamine 4,6-dehydratase (inverting)|nr:UDP-N-acetylglucosamine 4,6-dehydratase (inverting) [Elusimicrobiota bacterium]